MTYRNLVDLVQGGAAQEVEANHNFDLIEGGVVILDRDLTAPPGGESNGDAYIPTATATGAWTGQEGNVAVYSDGWLFFAPYDGLELWIVDEDVKLTYQGATPDPYALLGPQVTLTPAANIATDTSLSNQFVVTLDQDSQLDNPNRILPGVRYAWEIVQDSTPRTLSYGTDFLFDSSGAPTISTGSGARDLLVFDCLAPDELVLTALVQDFS